MHYFAFEKIKNEISRLNDKKYVILAGSDHMNFDKVPGLAELLQCPRWIISDPLPNLNRKNVIGSNNCKIYLQGNIFKNIDADALTIIRTPKN